MSKLLFTILLAGLLAGTTGCGDDDGSGPGPLPDAGASDAGGEPDAGLPSPRPVAPARDPEPLRPTDWYFVSVADPDADPVFPQIEDGSFEVPPADGVFRGVDWVRYEPGPMGEVRDIARPLIYATTDLGVPPGTGVIVRADRCAATHLGTQKQPGDFYGWRDKREALVVADRTAFLAQCFGYRGAPELELWTTPDELWMNLNDVTAPDLRTGEMDEQWLGVPILNLTDGPALDATARVVESDVWEETTVAHVGLPARAVTQVAFRLRPRAPFGAPTDMLPVRVRIESDSMRWSYEREIVLRVIDRGMPYRRTFRSAIDGSAQYFGVNPPADEDPARDYALVLSLHGASVQGIGQAQAYAAKDWAYVVAPTNRRPFGFDWEVWGRLDALEVLGEATRTFRIDPTRVYLTGHSMGGHGTWQLGTLFPGRFAVVAPSAGWASFYTYTGRPRPTGAFARAAASSDTPRYASNLARRAVYVIHGSADDNVPVTESRNWVTLLEPLVPDLQYHEEPGAGHWWDRPETPGADCVDWPELFATMQARTLDPTELEFDFLSPSPWVSPAHSYVTIRSALDPLADVRVVGALGATTDEVTLTTTNVRGMVLDGDALAGRGIARVVVDGTTHAVTAGEMAIGPQDGKRPGLHGPFDEVLMQPFCFVYDAAGPRQYADYAAYLASAWALIGNGQACAIPRERVTDSLHETHRLVWLGATPAELRWGTTLPFGADAAGVSVEDRSFAGAALMFVLPDGEGEHLQGVITAAQGSEHLLFRIQPFTSGFVVPDYLVWDAGGAREAGILDAEWSIR